MSIQTKPNEFYQQLISCQFRNLFHKVRGTYGTIQMKTWCLQVKHTRVFKLIIAQI